MSSWLCLPGTGSERVLTAALGMDPKTKAGSSISAAKIAPQGWHHPLGSEQAPSCMLPKGPFSYPTFSKEPWQKGREVSLLPKPQFPFCIFCLFSALLVLSH